MRRPEGPETAESGFASTQPRGGAGGNYDCADLYGETAGYGVAFRQHRAAASGNDDLADDTENGRIRLCIDAGPPRTLNEWERPPGTQESPERPFPKNPGSWREDLCLTRSTLLLPRHPRNRSSHRPRRKAA